jgi:hypothetical protein
VASVQHDGQDRAWLEDWWSAMSSGNQNGQKTLAIRALDAVLAEFGQG